MKAGYTITGSYGYTSMVAVGYDHTVGLKDDGTVIAVGDNFYGQCHVGGWDLN